MPRSTVLMACVLLSACNGDATPATSPGDETGDGDSTQGASSTDQIESSSSEAGTTGPSPSTGVGVDSTTDEGSSSDGVPSNSPVANDDQFEVPQSQLPLIVPAATGLLPNDEDRDGDPLEVTRADASSARGAAVNVAPDGGFTYDPPPSIWGEDSFSYSIRDPDGNEATATVRVLVRATALSLSLVAQGNGGFVIQGESSSDFAGSAVDGGRDVDGDGIIDLLVGAFGATPSGGASGRTYMVSGGGSRMTVSLTSVAAGNGGFAIDGEAVGDVSGEAARLAGDVNGDGLGDIIVGARGSDALGSESGRAYVVFGTAAAGPIALSGLGAGGFIIDAQGAGDRCGLSVSGIGDVDGDGLDDLIVGCPYGLDGEQTGHTYVVFGKADATPVALADVALGVGGFAIVGEDGGDRSGFSVDAAGDVNGDGLDDVVLGALRADPQGSSSGRAYVVFGKADTAAVPLVAVVGGVGGFAIDGAASGDRSGRAVAGAGDVDGDGLADVIIGAPDVGSDAGAAYVVLGKADGQLVSLGSLANDGAGFVLDGAFEDEAGTAVSGASDVDGDGLADVIVGAPGSNGGGFDSGRAYVVFGKADLLPIDLSTLPDGDGLLGFAIDGAGPDHSAAGAVRGVRDFDGDGLGDLLIGATGATVPGPFAGAAYLVHGVRRHF